MRSITGKSPTPPRVWREPVAPLRNTGSTVAEKVDKLDSGSRDHSHALSGASASVAAIVTGFALGDAPSPTAAIERALDQKPLDLPGVPFNSIELLNLSMPAYASLKVALEIKPTHTAASIVTENGKQLRLLHAETDMAIVDGKFEAKHRFMIMGEDGTALRIGDAIERETGFEPTKWRTAEQ